MHTAHAQRMHSACAARLLVDVRHPSVVALHSLLRLGLLSNTP